MEFFNGKVEAGKPAIILKSVQAPQLVGAVVDVIAYMGTGDSTEFEQGRHLHNPEGNRMWYVKLENQKYQTVNGLLTDTGCIREQWLMPIPPLKDEQLQKETEKELENA